MDMYQAIFKRKSIRNYDMNSLDTVTLEDIEKYLKSIKSYNVEIKTETRILNDEKQIGGMFKVKAPHYIAITSEKKEDYLVNVGYILEQIVIYLTSKGIGTCWLGSSKPNDLNKSDNNPLDFIVMIAFGKSNESIYRDDISKIKRKSITEISNLTETNNIIEAIRLAPSGVNQQAWYFDFKENEISVYRKQVLILMEKLSKIDIGVAIAHIYIAAQNEGKNIELVNKQDNIKNGYEYVITCKLV